MSNACQLRTGAIIYFAGCQNLVSDASAEAAKLDRKTSHKSPKYRRAVALSENRCTCRHRLIAQGLDFQDSDWFKRSTFNLQKRKLFSRIAKVTEAPDASPVSQVDTFRHGRELLLKLRNTRQRSQGVDSCLPHWRLRAAPN